MKSGLHIQRILLAGLLTYSGVSWSNETVLELSCKILSQQVTVVTDGRVTISSGWKDGPIVGDSLILRGRIKNPDSNFSLIDPSRDKEIIGLDVPTTSLRNGSNFLVNKMVVGRHINPSVPYKFMWGSDYINFEAIRGTLTLYRYYKSDWDGIFIEKNDRDHLQEPSHWIMVRAVNCRTIANGFDEVFSRFESAR